MGSPESPPMSAPAQSHAAYTALPGALEKGASLRCHFFSKAAEVALLQVDQQERNGGGRDARQARGLAQGFRTVLVETLTGFNTQSTHLHVVQLGRQAQVLVVGGAFHFVL